MILTVTRPRRDMPTTVLVHGGCADASVWGAVIAELARAGAPVRAAANPLRGLRTDAAYLASVVRQIQGPVVLAGHGYGGAVVTNAALDAANVVGLVFVAAFGLGDGESCRDIVRRFPETAARSAVRAGTYPDPGQAGGLGRELHLAEDLFADVVAADVPRRVADALAARQRPIVDSALTTPSGRPAWTRLPSWYAIATADRVLHPSAQRFMAQRMAATEVEIDASHAVPLSQPAAVAELIRAAAS